MRKRILVIEDASLVRMTVRRGLEKIGFEVLELANCEEFLERPLRFRNINLIVLDIMLPGMDGITFLEQIRKSKDFALTPVIMLTKHSEKPTLRRALCAGAVDFICKPFIEEELLARVVRAIGEPEDHDLITLLRREVSRARRGKGMVSLVAFDYNRSLACQFEQLFKIRLKIAEQIREIDTVLLTKDKELYLLLPATDPSGSQVVVEKIREYLPAHLQWTIGSVSYPRDGGEAEKLLETLGQRSSRCLEPAAP